MRFPTRVCLILVSCLLPALANAQTDVVTTSGTVHGAVVGPVLQWLGVPYAEPPVGSSRWTRSVAKTPSLSLIDATTAKASCMQVLPTFSAQECRDVSGQGPGTLVGSEDCLTLSIYRPVAASLEPRPVMVWIHGGAFTSGCAKDGLTNGSELAQHGTDGQIVVAIQYRLGPMGFFALEELAAEDIDASAGNYGMLDMVLALEWVQNNIAAFGGDPANVTIFGESAGGVATCALLASPLTEGLFQRAVTESGSCSQAIPLRAGANSGLPATSTSIGRGETLSAHATLACGDPGTRLACMRAKTPAQIYPAFATMPAGIAGPATNMAIDDFFIDEQPQVMLQDGDAGTRGLLIGTNANEMTLFTITLSVPDAAAYEAMVRASAGDYVADYLLPIWPALDFTNPTEAWRRFAEDIGFVCPSFSAAKAVSDGGGTAHVYHFAYAPNPISTLRSFHGLELFYVFGQYATRLPPLGITPDAGDADLSVAMQEAWTSYARTGAPVATPAWPAFAPAPSGYAADGSALVFDVTPNPGNVLANSVALAALLRDGRCAELEVLGPLLNADADNRTNDVDNCDYTANSDQADSASVGGGGFDGIGDACQCGDTTDDADVDSDDVVALRLELAEPASLSPAGIAKCSVAGGNPLCDVLDFAVLSRRLAGLDPQLAQDCAAANPS